METIIILLKSRDLVKPNQFKIFGYGNLAALLLTIVSFTGMVSGQFHMTNITQMPQPSEQVIDNGDGGDGGDVGDNSDGGVSLCGFASADEKQTLTKCES